MDIENKLKLPNDFKDLSKNIILYGPPGTGKTYNTAKLALWICGKGDFGDVNPDDYEKVMEEYRTYMGKGRIKFVTFHQSYGYEEFIEGIKPDVKASDIKYKLEEGVFKAFCDEAGKNNNEDKSEPYVFIIDEINRGNISKIFGELITLIEDSKRAGKNKPEAMSAILPYSKEEFSVPDNVYIIGTMNTADRSIAMLDTALRRRFSFIEMLPDTGVINGIMVEKIDVSEMLKKINERIEIIYDREHTIDHAFFTGLKNNNNIEKLASIFENKVMPLLQEYFYDDYQKINWILGGGAEEDKKTCGFLNDKKISDPFQSDVKTVYSIADHGAFIKKENYINIYGKAEENDNKHEEDDKSATSTGYPPEQPESTK